MNPINEFTSKICTLSIGMHVLNNVYECLIIANKPPRFFRSRPRTIVVQILRVRPHYKQNVIEKSIFRRLGKEIDEKEENQSTL